MRSVQRHALRKNSFCLFKSQINIATRLAILFSSHNAGPRNIIKPPRTPLLTAGKRPFQCTPVSASHCSPAPLNNSRLSCSGGKPDARNLRQNSISDCCAANVSKTAMQIKNRNTPMEWPIAA